VKIGYEIRHRLLIVSILASLFFIGTAGAGGLPSQLLIGFDGPTRDNGIPQQPWSIRLREGKAGATVTSNGGREVLHLKCLNSSFAVERSLTVIPSEYPLVSWEWKAVKLPASGDLREKSRNDQAMQIMFVFEGNRVISYVWDSNAPEGTISDESIGWPFNLRVKVLVVKSGHGGIDSWLTATRNIYEDYKALFHEEPLRLIGLRVQTNTQYTKDSAEGFVGKIAFSQDYRADVRQ
jgi:hypothetical protein